MKQTSQGLIDIVEPVEPETVFGLLPELLWLVGAVMTLVVLISVLSRLWSPLVSWKRVRRLRSLLKYINVSRPDYDQKVYRQVIWPLASMLYEWEQRPGPSGKLHKGRLENSQQAVFDSLRRLAYSKTNSSKKVSREKLLTEINRLEAFFIQEMRWLFKRQIKAFGYGLVKPFDRRKKWNP